MRIEIGVRFRTGDGEWVDLPVAEVEADSIDEAKTVLAAAFSTLSHEIKRPSDDSAED